jgi:hypothetical protein
MTLITWNTESTVYFGFLVAHVPLLAKSEALARKIV